MLFPPQSDYTRWMQDAGFTDVRVRALAPDWYRDSRVPYALAVSGAKPRPGPSPAALAAPVQEAPAGPLRFAARFVAGSAAGAVFVPIAAALALRARRAERRASA
jgi:MPBQ/MSBQ methyltransferase